MSIPVTDLQRRTFLVSCLLPMLASVAACQRPQGLLKVCRHIWPGYMLLDLARAQGWLPENQFRLINLGSAKGTLRALSGNSIDVACLTLDEVLSARANGLLLQVIGMINVSHGADVVIARRGIELRELKGLRLGYEQGAVGQVMLEQLLSAARLKRGDLQLMPMGSEEHISRFKNQEIDILITFEPIASQILSDPSTQIIYSSRDCPNLIVDVFAATPHAIAAHQAPITELLAAHYRAQSLLQSGSSAHMAQFAQFLNVNATQLRAILQGLQLNDRASSLSWLSGANPPLRQAALQLNRLLNINEAQNQAATASLIDVQFMRALS